jgi:hypothetical protein
VADGLFSTCLCARKLQLEQRHGHISIWEIKLSHVMAYYSVSPEDSLVSDLVRHLLCPQDCDQLVSVFLKFVGNLGQFHCH